MAFHSVIFPTMLKVGTKSSTVYEVDIFEKSLAGTEQRNLYHTGERRVFSIEKGAVTEEQKDELVAFWNARKGTTHSFYYQEGPETDFESFESSYRLTPVRFNMDMLEVEAGGPEHWNISGIELIEVIGEVRIPILLIFIFEFIRPPKENPKNEPQRTHKIKT